MDRRPRRMARLGSVPETTGAPDPFGPESRPLRSQAKYTSMTTVHAPSTHAQGFALVQ